MMNCRACGFGFDAATSVDGRCPACGQVVFVRAAPANVGMGTAALDPLAQQHSQRVTFAQALWSATPRVFIAISIIAINVIVFAIACLLGAGVIMPDVGKMLELGADSWFVTTGGQWWRLISSAFLHFGILHLAFNMWALYSAGPLTERLFGNWFFLLIYLFSAVAGSFASLWWEPNAVSAGASGAIFGVYGALIAYLLAQAHVFPRGVVEPLLKSTLVFVGYNVIFGLMQPGISNAAHLGGLAAGFGLGYILARPLELKARRAQATMKFGGGLVIAAAVLAGVFAAIPKVSQAEVQFIRLVEQMQDQRPKLIDRYNELLEQYKAEKLEDAAWADKLAQDVLPGWEQLHSSIGRIELPAASRMKPARTTVLKYLGFRQESLRTMIRGLREQDAALLNEAGNLMKKSEAMLPEVASALRQLPH